MAAARDYQYDGHMIDVDRNAAFGREYAVLDRHKIPSTVSPEAAAALEAVYADIRQFVDFPLPESDDDWDKLNALGEAFQLEASARYADKLGVVVTEEYIGGISALRIRPAKAGSGNPLLVYIHGGGYVFFSARSSLTIPSFVAAATGCEVLSINYTLAPNGKWGSVTDEVLAFWLGLLATGVSADQVGIFGDSAGGGLAAGAVLKMRDCNMPMPGALFLLSPWSDITPTGDTIETLAQSDPTLNSDLLAAGAARYASRPDQSHPYVSPVNGDFTKGFPPTIIQAGTREMFLSHAVRLYQALRNAGQDAVLDIYEGMPHVWQALIPDTPEAKISIGRGAEFLKKHLVASGQD